MSEKGRFLKTEELKIHRSINFRVVYKNKYSFVRTYCKKKKPKTKTFNENFKVSERWLQKFRICHERHYFQMPLKNLVRRMKVFWLPMRK
jgi:hypothetical protein